MKAYHLPTDDELEERDYSEDCDLLIGPNGFECMLGELEDRTWYRDGVAAVNKLNELHEQVQYQKAVNDALVKLWDARCEEPCTNTICVNNIQDCMYELETPPIAMLKKKGLLE